MNTSDLWQEAQDRVLLYLKKLGVPAIESLDVAREALRKASAEIDVAETDRPLALAMRALGSILRENPGILANTPYAGYPMLYRRWQPEDLTMPASCTVTDPGAGGQRAGLPPIARTSMIIKKI